MRMTLCTANGLTPLEAPAAGAEGDVRRASEHRDRTQPRRFPGTTGPSCWTTDWRRWWSPIRTPTRRRRQSTSTWAAATTRTNRPGLAHFLEHMLFLGTGKYPDAGEHDRFLAEHGGSGNAATSFAHTNFFFDVNAAHLEGALDRCLAQFFISPRFDCEYVERERQVVHSEFIFAPPRRRDSAAWPRGGRPSIPDILSRGSLAGNAEDARGPPGRRRPRRAESPSTKAATRRI